MRLALTQGHPGARRCRVLGAMLPASTTDGAFLGCGKRRFSPLWGEKHSSLIRTTWACP